MKTLRMVQAPAQKTGSMVGLLRNQSPRSRCRVSFYAIQRMGRPCSIVLQHVFHMSPHRRQESGYRMCGHSVPFEVSLPWILEVLASRLPVGLCVKGSCCRCRGLSKAWFLASCLYTVVVPRGHVLHWGWAAAVAAAAGAGAVVAAVGVSLQMYTAHKTGRGTQSQKPWWENTTLHY